MARHQVAARGSLKFKVGLLAVALMLFLYGLVYFWFRESRSEVRKKDGKEYVIFPNGARALYWLFRPATYVDGFVTGMNFHIGPHPEDR